MAEEPLPDTLNAAWKNDKSRFGYKMLSKMGWSEDKGLGKDETGILLLFIHTFIELFDIGIIQAVKISKREDGLGIGVEKDQAGDASWSTSVNSFNAVLDLLKKDYSKDSSKKTKKSKKSTIVQVGMK